MSERLDTWGPGVMPARIEDGIVANGITLGTNGGFEPVPDLGLVPPLPDSPMLRSIGTIFTLRGFEEAHTPLQIGEVDLSEVPRDIDVEGMAVKFPGTGYRVPSELACVSDALVKAISTGEAVNPKASDDYYAYVTLQRTWVERDKRQRTLRPHTDGMQGARFKTKLPTEYCFSAVDRDPTKYFVQPFDMTGIDV